MIARAPYLFLLLIIIPDLYLDLHYWRHRYAGWSTKRLLYWTPTIGMIAYTLYLMYEKNFIPDNPTILYIYLLLLGLIIIPKWIFMLCSITGLGFCRLFRKKKNYGNLIGLCLVPLLWFVLIYGSTIGFEKLEVNQQTYTSPDLPAAFDGYRIVLFSDAHVGSYKGRQHILQNAIDHINAQHPDLIVYTGDLQNTQPQDLYEHMDILSSLKAKDGVYSVLGNHLLNIMIIRKINFKFDSVAVVGALNERVGLGKAAARVERENARRFVDSANHIGQRLVLVTQTRRERNLTPKFLQKIRQNLFRRRVFKLLVQ